MFDNLREQANAGEPSGEDIGFALSDAQDSPTPSPQAPSGRLLGMTPRQRLLISLLLMVAVCVVGAMCLLVTGRIGAF